MPKQQITIEVDVPDGYEATGEFRSPTLGDVFLQRCEVKRSCYEHYACDYVILREKWKWPESVTANWIATDSDGRWVTLSDCEPPDHPIGTSRSVVRVTHINWAPPPPGTKHKNPNAK